MQIQTERKGLHGVVTIFQQIQRPLTEKEVELMGLQLTPLRWPAYSATQANWNNAQFSDGRMLQAVADDRKHSVQISSCS